MAFRQPTFTTPRQISVPYPPITAGDSSSSTHQIDSPDLPKWVLFSPSQVPSASTAVTPGSAGQSRLSGFGSLNSPSRFREDDLEVWNATEEAGGGDEDLDSLDEGLHAFQDHLMYQNPQVFDGIASMLPKHDGFGTFPASSAQIQEQMWHFEQYSHRKRSAPRRRVSSVQRHFDGVLHDDFTRVESERMARIEVWSMEQSKILMENIQSDTNGRRISQPSCSAKQEYSAPGTDNVAKDLSSAYHITDGLDQGIGKAGEPEVKSNDTFLERITQQIIHDLLGIDDALLSVIFGESLPAEKSSFEGSSVSLTFGSRSLGDSGYKIPAAGWDNRLFDRLARELGILVKYLTNHPGPFSTPLNPANLDYAGFSVSRSAPPQDQQESSAAPPLGSLNSSSYLLFKPTLEAYPSSTSTSASDTTHAALWGIEEEIPDSSPSPATQDRDFWERTPDLSSIFRVLHHRFSSPLRPPNSTPNIATTVTPASLHRTAVIRQNHPLVSVAARRNRNAGFPHYHPHHRRTESICKSQSIRYGGRGRSGSSRNYWDLGGGSAGGSAGSAGVGLGAWGEV